MDIIVPTKKINIVTDATLLSAVMTCGRFSDLRFNHNYESPHGKSNSLECGSICHKVVEVRDKLVIGGMSKKDANNYGLVAGQLYAEGCPHCLNFISTPEQLKPSCGHERNEYPGVKNTPVDSEGYLIGWKYALETMVQYFDYYKNDFWVPLEIETVRGKQFYEDDNIRILFKSKFDAIVDTNQGIAPMDRKTMKQNRDTLSLNNQFMGQAINSGTRQVWVDKIGFQKTLPAKEKFLRVPVSYSMDNLLEFQSETVPYWCYKMLEYKETNHYPPNHTNCDGKFGQCVYVDVCKADRNMRNEILKLNFIIGEPWNPSNMREE